MTPEWGPNAWKHFHTRALEYSDDPCECEMGSIAHFYYKTFLAHIKCQTCQQEYLRLLRINPIQACSRDDLFKWTVRIHNMINAKLQKPACNERDAYRVWSNRSCDLSTTFPSISVTRNYPCNDLYKWH